MISLIQYDLGPSHVGLYEISELYDILFEFSKSYQFEGGSFE